MTWTIFKIMVLRLFNNPVELLLVFLVPILFFSIFAAIFSRGIATSKDKQIRVAWVEVGREEAKPESQKSGNGDHQAEDDDAIGGLFDVLQEHESINCTQLEAGPNDESAEEIVRGELKTGKYDLIVRIPSDFSLRTAETTNGDPAGDSGEEPTKPQLFLLTDGQNPMAEAMVRSLINGYFTQQAAARIANAMPVVPEMVGIPATSNRDIVPLEDVQPEKLDPMTDFYGMPLSEILFKDKQPKRLREADFSPDYLSPRLSSWIDLDSSGQIWLKGVEAIVLPQTLMAGDLFPNSATTTNNEEQTTEVAASEHPEAVPPVTVTNNKFATRTSFDFTKLPVDVVTQNPQAEARANPKIALYAAGIAVLFLLFSATGNAATLLEEQESGTMDRILASRAGLFHVIAGKWVGIFLLGCLQITVMFFWAQITYDIDLYNHLPGFFAMTLSTAAATSSFAMALATLSKSRSQLNALSIVIILSMSALGGSMIPRFAMSDRMKEIGQWTFNAWALDGYQKVFWYDQPVSNLRLEVLVLCGSAAILGTLALILSTRWKRG